MTSRNLTKPTLVAISVLFIGFVWAPSNLPAQFNEWTQPAGGSWFDPDNWSDGVLPGATTNIGFFLDANYEVRWDAGATNSFSDEMWVHNGNVSFVGIGGLRSHTMQSSSLLLIRNGGVLSLGDENSGGEFTLNASNIDLQDDGFLEVRFGGTLNVSRNFNIGYVEEGHIDVLGRGTVNSDAVRLGLAPHSFGSVLISGPEARWNATGEFVIADVFSSSGSLGIENRGILQSVSDIIGREGSGSAYVDGVGSQWNTGELLVARNGDSTGRLDINAGGIVNTLGDPAQEVSALIGSSTGSTGIVTVDGTGSLLQTRTFNVGWAGNATLEITDGGRVTSSTANVASAGAASVANVIVDGPASRWDIDGKLNVGFDGEATVAVSNGGMISAAFVELGGIDGTATVNLSDNGQLDIHSGLINTATGTITGIGDVTIRAPEITNAGLMSFSGQTTIESDELVNAETGTLRTNSAATTRITGDIRNEGVVFTGADALTIAEGDITGSGSYEGSGEVFVRGDMRLGSSPAVILFDGDVRIDDGVNMFVEMLTGHGTIVAGEDSDRSLINDGQMIGTSDTQRLIVEGLFQGTGYNENVTFEGTFGPGASPAQVATRNLRLGQGSTLQMELGGLLRDDEYDAIVDDRLLELGGTLEVLFLNGFTPEQGDIFDLLDWNLLSGNFDNFRLAQLGGSLRWDTSQLYSSGSLVVSAVPEPASVLLFGLILVAGTNRRRKRY